MGTLSSSERRLDGDHAACVSWAGTDHLVVSYRNGFIVVLKASKRGTSVRTRGFVQVSKLNSGCCAGRSAAPHERPTVLAAGGLQNTVEVWSLGAESTVFMAGVPAAVLRGHEGYVSAVSFVQPTGGSGGHHLLSASGDGTCRLWDVDKAQTVLGLLGHQGDISGLKVPTDCGGRLAVTSSLDTTVRVWDLRTGACVRLFEAPGTLTENGVHRAEVEGVDMTGDGTLVAAAMRFGWATYDVRGYGVIGSAKTRTPKTSIAFVGNGKACIGGSELGTLRVIDTFRPERRHTPEFECSPGVTGKSVGGAERADRVATLASCPDGSPCFASASLRSGIVRTWGWTHDPRTMQAASVENHEPKNLVACSCCFCCGTIECFKGGRGARVCCCDL